MQKSLVCFGHGCVFGGDGNIIFTWTISFLQALQFSG